MAALIAAAADAAQAQTPGVTLSGRVVEGDGATPLEGVTVELRGIAERITDERGGFSFENLAPATYTLRVRALGYRTHDTTLTLRRDTSIVLTLAVDPVLLDSIRADARFVTLEGRVTDRLSGRGIAHAAVYHGPDRDATSRVGGSFRLERMPEGYPTVIEVSALGYQPVRLTVIPEEDRDIVVSLDVDSIGLQMIERQVERLHGRVKSIAVSLRTIDRRALMLHATSTTREVVRSAIPNTPIRCLVVDENAFGGESLNRRTGRGELDDVLLSLHAEEIERIEILGRGAMVRIYTRPFIQRMIRNRALIQPILWGFGGCH
jgi:Carboxypeptidase regulatory-like domain